MKDRTVAECAAMLLKKLLRMQDMIIALWTVCLAIGLFSGVVTAEKFSALANLYMVVFGVWAGAGVAKKAVDGKKPQQPNG
jgi:TRAP-type C4-dicarboxylate transport system permease large subunit